MNTASTTPSPLLFLNCSIEWFLHSPFINRGIICKPIFVVFNTILIYDTFSDERASSIASLAMLLDVSSVTSASLTSSFDNAGLSACSSGFSFSPSDCKKQ